MRRPGRGCWSCRTRHMKCTRKDGQSDCVRCQEAKRECIFNPDWSFKPVKHVHTASQGVRVRTELVYDPAQPWVSSGRILRFVPEDGSGLEVDATAIAEDQSLAISPPVEQHTSFESLSSAQQTLVEPEDASLSVLTGPGPDQALESLSETVPTEGPYTYQTLVHRQDAIQDWDTTEPQPVLSRSTSDSLRLPSNAGSVDASALRPILSIGDLRLFGTDSPANGPAVGYASSPGLTATTLSHREVRLIQHFVHKLSPWLDVCDVTARFAHEVPIRARRSPVLLYSVLAVSSKHQANDEDGVMEASNYHGRCLELVVQALDRPDSCYDDALLATIVCLRFYEEFDGGVDSFLHLSGVARLLRAIPHFSHCGGLAEAASWQALRQDIYASLVKRQPPTFELDNYNKSGVFDREDFGAAANVIILLFAKILRYLYSSGPPIALIVWKDLENAVEHWYARRGFQPSFYRDTRDASEQAFPIICMVSSPQVVALQYYYACKIYLRLHQPTNQQYTGFEAAREQRRAERDIVTFLCLIIGLARSNAWVENANFTACHILRTCGYCMTDHIQREHSLQFLQYVKESMGYDTKGTIQALEQQWRDLDDLTK